MDDLKFSVLSRIHQATRLAPVRRTELLSGAQDVPGTSRAIKELISSGFVREELGSDALYIQPSGTAALEAEIERRSAAQVGSSQCAQQLAALQQIADAAKEEAAAAKLLSETAQKKAGKADIKGGIAVLISILGFLVELAANWDKVLELLKNIASALK